MDIYKAEVAARFDNTDAFKEYEQKSANYTKADFTNAAEGLDLIFKNFAKCKAEGNSPDSEKAVVLVKELQNFITNKFYTCTHEILKSLGVMYTLDERFAENIDKHGEGTALFVSSAIEIYCKTVCK